MKSKRAWFSQKTARLRYSTIFKIIKTVTPHPYTTISQTPCSVPRPMIEFAQEYFSGKPVVGVEIGVFKGENAKSILQILNVEKLFLIDPYMSYGNGQQRMDLSNALSIARERLSPFRDKIEWVKKPSFEALRDFEDGFFDFVYVDGNHVYDFVKKDLEGYWPKLKHKGIFGGHDMIGDLVSVCMAVTDFSRKINQIPSGKRSDYWFIKT